MLSIDFEFNQVSEPTLNLVCSSIINTKTNTTHEFWLHNNPQGRKALVEFIQENNSEIFLGFQCAAEARCFYSLGLDPVNFNWIDTYLEYRCLSNHNDELNYGKQLVDGKVKFTSKPPPKWERTEEDSATGFKPKFSLAETTYKLLGKIRDTEHKEEMRQLIISDPKEFSPEEREAIQKYGTDDVVDLLPMFEKIVGLYKKYTDKEFDLPLLLKEMKKRGEYAALTGVREAKGYPIAFEETKNFSSQVLSILDDCQREINKLFPDIKPFRFNKKENRFSWNQKITREWIKANVPDHDFCWKKTDKKQLSLSLEAFTQIYDYKHHYPKDVFGAQMVRFLKLKQTLYGFMPSQKAKKDKKTFWDSVGSDQRVRPYMNIYGSQSSRSQPPSTSYMLLKPAWMRSLIQPAPGRCITSIDYGSEEYFITGLFYRDAAMIGAYLSGDVYLAFAIESGIAPKGATKETHKFERNLAKATCLKEGSLVRVKDRGFVPIEEISETDQVWDGTRFRKHMGVKFMGSKKVIKISEEVFCTPDHLVLGSDDVWREADFYTREKVREGKVYRKDTGGLRECGYTWSDVRSMASLLWRQLKKR